VDDYLAVCKDTSDDSPEARIGRDNPADADADGKFPLHHAIQDTKNDPKLIKVVIGLMDGMTAEDNTCSNHTPE